MYLRPNILSINYNPDSIGGFAALGRFGVRLVLQIEKKMLLNSIFDLRLIHRIGKDYCFFCGIDRFWESACRGVRSSRVARKTGLL